MLNLEEKHLEIRNQRSDFLVYKHNVEKDLEKALNTIAEANVKEESLKTMHSDLDTRETNIRGREEYLDKREFGLSEAEKVFNVEKENYESLKEVVT